MAAKPMLNRKGMRMIRITRLEARVNCSMPMINNMTKMTIQIMRMMSRVAAGTLLGSEAALASWTAQKARFRSAYVSSPTLDAMTLDGFSSSSV